MARTTEGATECVEAVRFGFLTDEEVRRYSVKKITNPVLLDGVGRPVPGGLYDPTLGPMDDRALCKTCGQRSFHCPGHSGHIVLVSPLYNPLLFSVLFNLLQRTCFFCHHFKAPQKQVKKCAAQLRLILKGDIAGAKKLESASLSEFLYPEDSGETSLSCSTVHSGAEDSVYLNRQEWTSLQLTEALSTLSSFLKLNSKVCKNCEAKNPTITKPTFGWIHMKGMPNSDIRSNIIKRCNMQESFTDGAEDQSSSEIQDVNDRISGNSVKSQKVGRKKRHLEEDRAPADFVKQKNLFSGPLLPTEARDILKLLWENQDELCSIICDIQQASFFKSGKKPDYSMFFVETIYVPPIKFRPPTKGSDSVMEHPQTVLLSKVLQANISLGNAYANISENSKIVARWIDLQQSVNTVVNGKNSLGQRDVAAGICQLLEKKEGLFRQKLMGKRVNFSCRSVISPDPHLAVNEIGIPPYFALRLTYPERVTPWNITKLRTAIVNGPEIHPGATHYVDNLSTVKLPVSRKMRISMSRKLPSSRGVVTQPGKGSCNEFEGKIVYRHLQDGDIVLVNRQPTLHKPSMMAHIVRVLKGEKTLRMHYANCSTYNADFDGDEMNVHFPQDEISRAESYSIVNANNQYIIPTNGDPKRDLIQDHIVSAVLLTKKDTFLTLDEFNHLVYCSGVYARQSVSLVSKPGKKVSILDSADEVLQLPCPAIIKPEPLWTGKQVITAVLNKITRGCKPFTVRKGGRIPKEYFGSNSGESKLFIHRNELLLGVIDKGQFGKFGLVHTVHELYGSNTAGTLLSALSRLFTVYLQMHGFTCGVDDLLLADHFESKRMTQLETGENIGEHVHAAFVGLSDSQSKERVDNNRKRSKTKKQLGNSEKDSTTLQMEIERVIRGEGDSAITRLDRMMASAINELNTIINKELLPYGISKPFPHNCLALMTSTGAKGGAVNFHQISTLLGQQELEGKRVPRMVSGKTLPCFPPWDYSTRSGGFISDRFLSGLRPQEYYFHCMAGREGLVDTAVKTSRSGYLQRCLIKNLECLKVCYDYTVRDTDGSIVQFSYGEDGVDVHQTSFVSEFKALAKNREILSEKFHCQLDHTNTSGSYSGSNELPTALTELKDKANKFIERSNQKQNGLFKIKDSKEFMNIVKQKYYSSLAQPGEAVGVIAAQSVGEPSTQMTLNTFHLAGRGEMNVTLGIPRLQEILRNASANIKTPTMTCPLLMDRSKDDAEHLAAKLRRVSIADITESTQVDIDGQFKTYKLKMKLYEPNLFPPHSEISLDDCHETLRFTFLREMEDAIESHLLLLSKISGIKNFVEDSKSKVSEEITDEETPGGKSQGKRSDDGDDDDEAGGTEDEDGEGLDTQKRKNQSTDEVEYEDDSDYENHEPELSVGFEEESDQTDDENHQASNKDGETGEFDAEGEASELHVVVGTQSKSKKKSNDKKPKSETKRKKKPRRELLRKDSDRASYIKAKGLHFEIHFKFSEKTHILLDQIAHKTAKRVYIRSSGRIERCQVIDQKDRYALQTAGVDFRAFWEMQDDLDIRNIISNDVYAMLVTYGVEAARKTIINEVQNVFQAYGISVNFRHLSLIADYITQEGGYRPMNRSGAIGKSVSPLTKMSFETATKFIINAAYHGEMDNLESPSARICLGLPIKMGTGCFDLMQKLEVDF